MIKSSYELFDMSILFFLKKHKKSHFFYTYIIYDQF
jgi:hypothetical protein